MSRPRFWEEFRREAPKPPPKHGIKIKRAGTTWWGQRWVGALEQILKGDSGRLARGRTYARAGRTHDLLIRDGKVSAKVTGSRPKPYDVTIALQLLTEQQWRSAIAGMAAKAQFSAELLASRMPEAIEDVFEAAGGSLFPRQRAELTTSCSCPDSGDPCKHVAAAHYILGDALDRDPFLLFELRGRSKAQVLTALRAARAGEPDPELAASPGETPRKKSTKRASKQAVEPPKPDIEPPAVPFGSVDVADYDKPREPLPTLQFSFDAPRTDAAVLRQLGAPASWRGEQSPAEALADWVRAAADAARRIALTDAQATPASEPSATPERPDSPPTRSSTRKGSTKQRTPTKRTR